MYKTPSTKQLHNHSQKVFFIKKEKLYLRSPADHFAHHIFSTFIAPSHQASSQLLQRQSTCGFHFCNSYTLYVFIYICINTDWHAYTEWSHMDICHVQRWQNIYTFDQIICETK